MFPLKQRKICGYTFGVKTYYSDFHLGVDYCANFDILYAPFDGTIEHFQGTQGGLTIWFRPDGQDVLIRFLHLSQILVTGHVKEGTQIAVTGDSGTTSPPGKPPYAHLHLDISKHNLDLKNTGNFIDPEKFAWEDKPMPLTQKVLVLWSWIPNADLIVQGINQYLAEITKKTGGLFAVQLDYANTPAQFHTISTVTPEGTVTYVNPDEIIAEGAKVEQQTGKHYDVVCLIYDDTKIIGAPPNHPVDNPVYQDGFNVMQIPLSWISSLADPNIQPIKIYPDAVEIFFAHELSHADYFLANTRGNAGLRDKTHDLQNGQLPPGTTYTNPFYYFLDLLLELKPYWQFLVNQDAPVPPQEGATMIVVKFDDSNTEYVLADDLTLIGITSPAALQKTLKGRAVELRTFPAGQRPLFTIADSTVG